MITRDGIKRVLCELYGINSEGISVDTVVNTVFGIVPYFLCLYFDRILTRTNIAPFKLIDVFLIPFIPVMGWLIRKIFYTFYLGIAAVFVALIPKDEEEAYQRRMARQEKKKKHMDTGEHKDPDYHLSAFGNDQYFIAEEDPVQQNVK